MLHAFWATVCKMVRPIYRTVVLSRLSCLSVTLVYCGQTVGWMKMKLDVQVDLGPGHIVLDGDAAPPRKGHSSPHTFEIYGRRLCLRQYNPRPVTIAAKPLDGSRCHLVGR